MRINGAFSVTLLALVPVAGHADMPTLKTPAPVIYLADNLDEADQLGWCIDTLGRGFSDKLQAHSCKPRGGDVQFRLLGETGQIQSVAYPDYCAELLVDQSPVFGLLACNSTAPGQQFSYDPETQNLTPADDRTRCIAVGPQGRSAGPFISRDLLLAPCESIDPIYRTWIVLDD